MSIVRVFLYKLKNARRNKDQHTQTGATWQQGRNKEQGNGDIRLTELIRAVRTGDLEGLWRTRGGAATTNEADENRSRETACRVTGQQEGRSRKPKHQPVVIPGVTYRLYIPLQKQEEPCHVWMRHQQADGTRLSWWNRAAAWRTGSFFTGHGGMES